MLAADFGTCVSELEKEAVVLSFPKRYFDDPGDYDSPIVEIGLWAKTEGLFKWSGPYQDPCNLYVEIEKEGVYLSDILGDGPTTGWLWYFEDFEVSEDAILEEVKELWNYRPTGRFINNKHTGFGPIDEGFIIPHHVTTFILRKQTDEAVFAVQATFRFEWDDEPRPDDLSSSHLVLCDERPYKILLTPYDA